MHHAEWDAFFCVLLIDHNTLHSTNAESFLLLFPTTHNNTDLSAPCVQQVNSRDTPKNQDTQPLILLCHNCEHIPCLRHTGPHPVGLCVTGSARSTQPQQHNTTQNAIHKRVRQAWTQPCYCVTPVQTFQETALHCHMLCTCANVPEWCFLSHPECATHHTPCRLPRQQPHNT